MPRPLLIASSDWHLAPGAWKNRDVRGDAYFSLAQLVDRAEEWGCPLAGAGDLFDVDDPDPVSIGVMVREAGRLAAAGLPLYVVSGQHERRVDGRWLDLAPNAVFMDDMDDVVVASRFAVVNSRMAGWSWLPAAQLAGRIAIVNGYPDEWMLDPRHILVCHQVWREFLNFDESAEASLGQIRGACTIVTGDFHGGDESKRAIRVGDHLVLSPGSIAMQDITEEPRKGYFVLEEHEDGRWEWRRRYLETRAVFKYRALSGATAADVEQSIGGWIDAECEATDGWKHLPEALQRPIVAVWHWDDEPAIGEAARGFREFAHVFVRVVDRRREERKLEQAGLRPRRFRGLLDAIEQVVPAGDPRRVDLERLLGASDAPAELAAIKAEFFEKARP